MQSAYPVLAQLSKTTAMVLG